MHLQAYQQSPEGWTPPLFRRRASSDLSAALSFDVGAAEQFGNQVVVLSLQMGPSFSGLEMLRQIQSYQPSLPIVMMTLSSPAPQVAVSPKRNQGLTWLREHAAQVSEHKGQWLLIVDGELRDSSENFAQIKHTIAANNIRSPFVYYVPTDAESSFVLL